MLKQRLLKFKDKYKESELLYCCMILAILFLGNCFSEYFSYISFSVLAILVIISNMENGFSYLVYYSICWCWATNKWFILWWYYYCIFS